MTKHDLELQVIKRGYKVGISWEDDKDIYAFSLEGNKSNYGHPLYTAHYDKQTNKVKEYNCTTQVKFLDHL